MELKTIETTKEYVKIADIETIVIDDYEARKSKLLADKENIGKTVEAYEKEVSELQELEAKIAKAYADMPLPVEVVEQPAIEALG